MIVANPLPGSPHFPNLPVFRGEDIEFVMHLPRHSPAEVRMSTEDLSTFEEAGRLRVEVEFPVGARLTGCVSEDGAELEATEERCQHVVAMVTARCVGVQLRLQELWGLWWSAQSSEGDPPGVAGPEDWALVRDSLDQDISALFSDEGDE